MEISENSSSECILPTGLLNKPGLPLYFQLFGLLRDRIIDGDIPVGSTLPTEQRIAEHYSVSRITVREALNYLQQEQFIKKRTAKKALVLNRSPTQFLGWKMNSIDDIIAATRGVALKVKSYKQEKSSEVASLLELDENAVLYCLRSILMKNEQPYAVSTIYFPDYIGKELKRSFFNEKIIFRVVERELGIRANDVEIIISASLADISQASLLKKPIGSPILNSTLVYRNNKNSPPFEIAFTSFPAESYRIQYNIKAQSTSKSLG
ncbi:MAG: GntR family transcriptional regulator [Cyanobacteria bacterium]|nr:GntR family transcriptional regulator [Cyanobacteriota bacterium]